MSGTRKCQSRWIEAMQARKWGGAKRTSVVDIYRLRPKSANVATYHNSG